MTKHVSRHVTMRLECSRALGKPAMYVGVVAADSVEVALHAGRASLVTELSPY